MPFSNAISVNGSTVNTVASLFSTINSFFKVSLHESASELEDIVIEGPIVSLIIGLKFVIVTHVNADMAFQGAGGITRSPAVCVFTGTYVNGLDQYGATVNATSLFSVMGTYAK